MIALDGAIVDDERTPYTTYCHAQGCGGGQFGPLPAVAVALASDELALFRAPLCHEHAEQLLATGQYRDIRSAVTS